MKRESLSSWQSSQSKLCTDLHSPTMLQRRQKLALDVIVEPGWHDRSDLVFR